MSLSKKISKLFFVTILILSYFTVFASLTDGTINSTNHSSLLCTNDDCTTTSQINFKTTKGEAIHVTDSGITGNAWSETFGWINFNPTHGGVINTSEGILSGYAWGENSGWINFNPTNGGVFINNAGKFAGWAWAQNYGWIRFNCSITNACVETDWRPLSVRNNSGSSGGSSSGGSVFGGAGPVNSIDICPNITGVQSLIPEGLVISSIGSCITPQQCNIIDGSLKQPLDVMIIVDKSGSMSGKKLIQAKAAATAFIDNLVLGSDRVGYITYSDKAVLDSGLTSSFDLVKTKIKNTVVTNTTNIGGAVKLAYQEMNTNGRSGVKHVIILMTDGEANFSDIKGQTPNQYAINQSNIAKAEGMILYSVGLGTSVDSNLLKSVASSISNYYYSPTGNDLSSIYLKIAAIECTAAPSKVSNIIIYDKNANGQYDSGEVGLSNVTVILTSKNNTQPERIIKSLSDGSFLFDNVASGEYSICATPPLSMRQTFPLSSGCYNINVIQGINVNTARFMIAGVTIPTIPPVTPPVVPPVVPPTIPPVTPIVPPIVNPVPPINPPVIPSIDPINPNPINPPDNVLPPADNTDNVLPPNDSKGNNIDGNKNIIDKISSFFGSILGMSNNQNNVDETKDPLLDNKNKINVFVYDLELFSKKTADKTIAVFKNPTGKTITEIISTTGAATGVYFGVVNIAFSNPVSFAEIFLTPIRLWTLLLVAIGVKKRKVPWGTVYDSVTKQPIDPAYIVLQDLNGKEISTSITDLDGRYGFLIPPGKYRIIANKTNYQFPSKKLEDKNSDILYNDLYFGEILDIKEGEAVIKNIPMDPLKFDWNEFEKKDKNLMKFFSKREMIISRFAEILFAVGFIVSFISALISPIIFNLIIFILYLLIIILQKTILRPRVYGNIKQKGTDDPLSFAIIRIFMQGNNNEIIHKVTDKIGRYYCLIPNGLYYAKIESKNIDESYSLVYTSEIIEIKKGHLNKKFKV